MGKDLKGKGIGKGLRQRKSDRRYVARLTVMSGGRIEKAFDTLSEAKEWLEEQRHMDKHGGIVVSGNLTVDAWFKNWMVMTKPTIKYSSFYAYEGRYRHHIQPVIGGMRIADVRAIHCQAILNRMVPKYKGTTIQSVRRLLTAMFSAAADNDIITKSPVTKSGVKVPKEIERHVRVLSREEQEKFFAVASKTVNYRQYLLVSLTGLRAAELIGLKWSDIDWENHTIHVQRTLTYRYEKHEWMWDTPKTKNSNRIIQLPDQLYRMFLEMKDEPSRVTENTPKEFRNLIFLNRKGYPVSNPVYDSHVRQVCNKAGIKYFSMHSLRHTFATRAQEAGVDAKVLSEILGHSVVTTTMDIYVHVMDDTKRDEMEKLVTYVADNILKSKMA